MIFIYTFLIIIFLIVAFCLNRKYAIRYRITCLILGTPRERNQKHCYDYPPENNGWRKFGNSPVYGDKQTGTIFDPYVYIEDGAFYMCASERKHGCLIILKSNDGIRWSEKGIMLQPIADTWETIVNRGSVLHKGDKYYLWYTGQQNDCSAIGLAVSDDGITYKRIQTNPVLLPTMPIEGKSVMNPCVFWNEEKHIFQMWYSAGEAYEPDVICYAESLDGITWEKETEPVLAKYPAHEWEKEKVGGCNVLLNSDGTFDMFYIGYQNLDVARICVAHSQDGKRWTRIENNLIIGPSRGSWDADATYKPSIVRTSKTEYLWYNGRNAIDEYIGLATKKI